MGSQDLKVIRNSTEQLQRIQYLHVENENLAKDVANADHQIVQRQITVKSLVLQMAFNLEELWTLGDFQYPISCIYSVIARNLELKGISVGVRKYVYDIFAESENRKYMYANNDHVINIQDDVEADTLKPEFELYKQKVRDAIQTIKEVEAKTDKQTRAILQDVTIEINEMAPALVDRCDRAGITLPSRELKDEPVRIHKLDPKDNDLCGWLRLLIEELQKVHDKFLVYRTENPDDMKVYCAGVKVHVQLLRSLSNDKWARNVYTWLGVIRQKVSQSNHSAQSMSGIFGKITGKRNLTREQIKAKTEMIIGFAQEFIENSPGYWDMCYASKNLREPKIGDFHNNRHEKLSDSSIG